MGSGATSDCYKASLNSDQLVVKVLKKLKEETDKYKSFFEAEKQHLENIRANKIEQFFQHLPTLKWLSENYIIMSPVGISINTHNPSRKEIEQYILCLEALHKNQ